MTDVSPFDIVPESDYIYQQYRDNIELERFFNIVDEIIEEFYFRETLSDMWDCRNISNTNSPYMYFYARYYLGLIRPVRLDPDDYSTEAPSANIINQYDTAMLWDNRFIWDDYSITDPEMPMSMFIAMIRIVYDYSEITWTHDLMIRYVSVMCNMNPNDVQMSFEPNKVIYWLVNSQQCRSFIEYMAQDEYKLNFPFADCYEFRIGEHRKNTDRVDEFILTYLRPPTWPSLPNDQIPPPPPPVIIPESKPVTIWSPYDEFKKVLREIQADPVFVSTYLDYGKQEGLELMGGIMVYLAHNTTGVNLLKNAKGKNFNQIKNLINQNYRTSFYSMSVDYFERLDTKEAYMSIWLWDGSSPLGPDHAVNHCFKVANAALFKANAHMLTYKVGKKGGLMTYYSRYDPTDTANDPNNIKVGWIPSAINIAYKFTTRGGAMPNSLDGYKLVTFDENGIWML